MNVKNAMLLLALFGLGATSCSNDEPGGGQKTDPTAGTRNEIQIQFSGTGESQEYTKASTIASESENKIDKLSVYLFASPTGTDGTYVYMETWTEGTAYDAANPSTDFKIQDSGTAKKASIYPNERKGLPHLKLFCVVNNGSVGNPTDGRFYDAANAEMLQTLTPVTVDADGNVTNTPTTETDFKLSYTRFMKNVANTDEDIINTPLLMTGSGQVKISGSMSLVNITLKRAVARFDIENTTAKSQLTITKITLAQARKSASLWGITPTAVADKATDLMTYASVDYTTKANANLGLTESALYVYPGIKEDESYLIIEGTFKSPITTQPVPVTYHVPVAKTAETPGATAEFIPIKANSRYKLRITDVTQSNVYGTFVIEDWTSGGGINVKPDNDAPVFAGDAAFTGTNVPTKLPDGPNEGDINKYEVEGATGSFSIEIAATGKVRVEQASALTKAGIDWLTVTPQTPTEKDGVWYTKFDISYSNAIGAEPVALTFINEAASFDPALWTTVRFYGPKAVPAYAATTNPVITEGNKVDMSNPLAPVVSLYKIANGQAQIDVTCMEGILIGNKPAGIDVIAPANGGNTYTIKVSDASAVADGTIEFKNAGDDSKISSISVKALSPAMSVELPTTTLATMTGDATNGYEITVDLEALATNNFTFKVNSPEGLKASPSLTSGWLQIADGNDWAAGNTFNTYTVTAQGTDYTNTVLTFVNKLDGTPNVKVTLKKAPSKPKFAANDQAGTYPNSAFNTDAVVATDPTAATTGMFLANNSVIFVKATCPENLTFNNVAGLSVTRQASTDIYEIKVTDATKLTAGSTAVLEAVNSSVKSTLTITMKDPAINVSLTANANVVESQSGDDIVYTVDVANLSNFTFSVTAPAGATTDLSVLTGSFLKPHTSNTGTAALTAGVASDYMLRVDDDTQTADITMTFVNAVTGADRKVIFKVK